eukprot:SAG31_NODE_35_length_31836_cov_10.841352_18_plen_168_part_00
MFVCVKFRTAAACFCITIKASENSVGFYEHHGFVRVGAITRYEDAGNPADDVGGDSISDDDGTIQSPPADGDEKPPLVFGRHCSPTLNCCAKDNESPAAVAKRMGVAVKDVVFLNRHVPGLTATSKLQVYARHRSHSRRRVPVCPLSSFIAFNKFSLSLSAFRNVNI